MFPRAANVAVSGVVYFLEGAAKLVAQRIEVRAERLAARDDDVIMCRAGVEVRCRVDGRAQAAPDAIAHDRAADFLGNGQAEAGGGGGIIRRAGDALQGEARRMAPLTLCGPLKFGAFGETRKTPAFPRVDIPSG